MKNLPKKLPVGISTFSVIRNEGMVYVDKTRHIHEMTVQPGRFFLSRPRRFGKSLLVDTLKELFEGNEALFRGLYIHDKRDWSRRHPVIKIDFAGGELTTVADLDQRIINILTQNAERLGVTLDPGAGIPDMFGRLIREAARTGGCGVVALVDEYDKPILDNIDRPDMATKLRSRLKNLYSVLKEHDADLEFIFMTGVSKFSKVSLFSGLNQLEDISIDPTYSSICGYTEADVEAHLADCLEGVDREELRRWYDGYNWTGDESLYNPYDILLFIRKKHRFRNYWFETGNPAFLLKLFQKGRFFLPDLEGIEIGEEVLLSFDVEKINPITLLFQSGYLTIGEELTRRNSPRFVLRPPNREVRTALNEQVINSYTDLVNEKFGFQEELFTALTLGNADEIAAAIRRLFAAIPWRNFTNNYLADFEGYYASVLYAFFASLNIRVIPEDIMNRGQADLTLMVEDRIYVMEIKVTDKTDISDNPALEQIRRKDYAAKYRGIPGKTVHELGLVFSRKTRNLIRADEANLS